jgi:hypothetical protein
MAKMTMVQALNLALRQEMEKDDSIIVLGEDVGVDGGVFRVMPMGSSRFARFSFPDLRTKTFIRSKTMQPGFACGRRAAIRFPWSCVPRMAAESEHLNTIRKAGKHTGRIHPA